MNWVKSNIGLVVGGVVALALMGVAGWFLYTQMEAEKRAEANLDTGLSNLKSLLTRDPHPGDPDRGVDNIGAVQAEQEKVEKTLLGPLRSLFKPFDVPEDLDTFKFKSLLEERIAVMQRAARESGTGLPKEGDSKYSFSFSDIRPKVSFAPSTIQPMAFQLLQIESLAGVLFESKVHSINGIKRLEITEPEEDSEEEEEEDDYDDEETSSAFSSFSMTLDSDNYLEEGEAITNEITGAVIFPFQLSFQSFSSELSSVMAGLNDSDHFYRVKWVVVEQSSASSSQTMDPNAALYAPDPSMQAAYGGMAGGMAGGMDPSLAARYGMAGGAAGGGGSPYGGGRYGGAYGGGGYGAGGYGGMPMGAGMQDESSMDDLEEKPLTVNMLVEVISIPPKSKESEEDAEGDGSSGYDGF